MTRRNIILSMLASAASIPATLATAAPKLRGAGHPKPSRFDALYSEYEARAATFAATHGDSDCGPAAVAYNAMREAREAVMIERALTLHDMARKVWIIRDELEDAGHDCEALLADAARVIGPDALDAVQRRRIDLDARWA